MATRKELLEALEAAGYDGPVSYTKPRLEELLAEAKGEQRETVESPADEEDAKWEGEEIHLTEWMGLKGPHVDEAGDDCRGTTVKVDGMPGKTFEFLSYYRSESQEYVTVRGPLPNHANNRYLTPDRILHNRTRKPVLR